MSMFDQILDRQQQKGSTGTATKEFFANVYSYMFAALTITGLVAYVLSQNEAFIYSMFTETGMSPLGYVIMFAPLVLVLIIQAGFQRLPMIALVLLFLAYSVLLGMSLSFIFLVYSMGSIVATFFTTAGAFGAMALLGYFTKTDLTKFGSLLYMVFIGMFIASMVNFFIGSDTMGYIISFLGLFVFTGLTAYEMQRLKHISNDPELDGASRSKLALIGGLKLYILFINLFLSILRFMGNRE